MAKFRVGQRVYAPIYRYSEGTGAPYAIVPCVVREIEKRSCVVDLPYIGLRRFATSLLHASVGVCLVRIGDFRSEQAAMDPICKSILNYLRLVLPDDHVKSVGLRTQEELEELFEIYASAYTVWILVGHGTSAGEMCFTRNVRIRSTNLASRLAPHAAEPKAFLFLACHAGEAKFARPFSNESSLCSTLIGPTGPLHGAVAAQFAQSLLGFHYLEGCRVGVAFERAAESTQMSVNFRIWKNGKFIRSGRSK
jgi:hypothetical protein